MCTYGIINVIDCIDVIVNPHTRRKPCQDQVPRTELDPALVAAVTFYLVYNGSRQPQWENLTLYFLPNVRQATIEKTEHKPQRTTPSASARRTSEAS